MRWDNNGQILTAAVRDDVECFARHDELVLKAFGLMSNKTTSNVAALPPNSVVHEPPQSP
jgi:hypothetical protein